MTFINDSNSDLNNNQNEEIKLIKKKKETQQIKIEIDGKEKPTNSNKSNPSKERRPKTQSFQKPKGRNRTNTYDGTNPSQKIDLKQMNQSVIINPSQNESSKHNLQQSESLSASESSTNINDKKRKQTKVSDITIGTLQSEVEIDEIASIPSKINQHKKSSPSKEKDEKQTSRERKHHSTHKNKHEHQHEIKIEKDEESKDHYRESYNLMLILCSLNKEYINYLVNEGTSLNQSLCKKHKFKIFEYHHRLLNKEQREQLKQEIKQSEGFRILCTEETLQSLN